MNNNIKDPRKFGEGMPDNILGSHRHSENFKDRPKKNQRYILFSNPKFKKETSELLRKIDDKINNNPFALNLAYLQ
jgi:hypothetical protein